MTPYVHNTDTHIYAFECSRFGQQAKILFASDGSHAANMAFVLTIN
jgi:hypothetical protein